MGLSGFFSGFVSKSHLLLGAFCFMLINGSDYVMKMDCSFDDEPDSIGRDLRAVGLTSEKCNPEEIWNGRDEPQELILCSLCEDSFRVFPTVQQVNSVDHQ
jgi:hypothetical protein